MIICKSSSVAGCMLHAAVDIEDNEEIVGEISISETVGEMALIPRTKRKYLTSGKLKDTFI